MTRVWWRHDKWGQPIVEVRTRHRNLTAMYRPHLSNAKPWLLVSRRIRHRAVRYNYAREWEMQVAIYSVTDVDLGDLK